jgi:hypothetical protein
MQAFFNKAAAQNKIAYFDKGAYIARTTIQVPKDLKIVGELWAIIMSQGPFFGDQSNPKPMWRIGTFFPLRKPETLGVTGRHLSCPRASSYCPFGQGVSPWLEPIQNPITSPLMLKQAFHYVFQLINSRNACSLGPD